MVLVKLTDLQKKIHPKHTFLLACNYDYFRTFEEFAGSDFIALATEAIPPDFVAVHRDTILYLKWRDNFCYFNIEL